MNRERLIHAWLKALHARCAPSALEKAHEEYAGALADMVDSVPTEVFSQASYRWVAGECPKGAPNAAALRALLHQWERDHPVVPALPSPEGKAPLSSEALAYCRTFAQRWRDGADKKLITSIAKQHYPREAWLALKAEYGLE